MHINAFNSCCAQVWLRSPNNCLCFPKFGAESLCGLGSWVARADAATQVIPAVDEDMPQADENTSGVQRSQPFDAGLAIENGYL